MVIQLDPEHLGTVSIKLRMSGGTMQIDIKVANAQTLDVLSRDRHMLSAAVEAAGATQDNLLLGSAVDQAPTPDQGSGLAGSGTQAGRDQQQAFASSSSFDGGSRSGSRGSAADTVDSDMTRDDDNALLPNPGPRRLDGSLYV